MRVVLVRARMPPLSVAAIRSPSAEYVNETLSYQPASTSPVGTGAIKRFNLPCALCSKRMNRPSLVRTARRHRYRHIRNRPTASPGCECASASTGPTGLREGEKTRGPTRPPSGPCSGRVLRTGAKGGRWIEELLSFTELPPREVEGVKLELATVTGLVDDAPAFHPDALVEGVAPPVAEG